MPYRAPAEIGRDGEIAVLEALHAFARFRECAVLEDVRLTGRLEKPAQIDEILVDRYGVLIVETKVRTHAVLRGTDFDDRWTAMYPTGNKSFPNPLLQNRYHERILREALRLHARPLDPDYVSSLVVFVGGTGIGGLELDSLSRNRVTTLERLPNCLESRTDFAINRGVLSLEEIDSLATTILSLGSLAAV